jgi:hypothetical protein
LNNQDYRTIWVHGIGHPNTGYSIPWREAFNAYLKFPVSDYIETLWCSAFTQKINVISSTQPDVLLIRQEQAAKVASLNALATTLQARGSAIAEVAGPPSLGEWSAFTRAKATGVAELPSPVWILDPQDYVGEFVDYLINRNIRNAVKEKVKEQLRPLADKGYAASIIAHSWGTVVSYESLIDLERELPSFKLANLFTLGSPLWLVRHLLDDHSGRKPHNTSKWVNIHAQGDAIGSWLKPGFQVDEDRLVPDYKNSNDPHASYFLLGNAAVQHDIVSKTILGE